MIQELMRMGRFTRYLPYFRGIALFQRFYQFVLPKDGLNLRVDDFDGDLKMDVDVRDTSGMISALAVSSTRMSASFFAIP